jgi:hypothetical protein
MRLEHENWPPAMVAEFKRRQRGRNWALLGVLVGFCVLIYAVAVVKLHEYGQRW